MFIKNRFSCRVAKLSFYVETFYNYRKCYKPKLRLARMIAIKNHIDPMYRFCVDLPIIRVDKH